MSYYGIRKMKSIIDENGKYNITCEFYDSSIRDYRGNRVWDSLEAGKGFYRNGFNTKEELEYALFKDTLDGNIHGTGGKYSCISWGSNKVKLSDEEQQHIKELDDNYWALYNECNSIYREAKQENPNITLDELEANDPMYRKLHEELHKISKEKTEYRYNTYYTRWKAYLKDRNKAKASGKVYVIKCNYNGYTGIYIKSLGSSRVKFCYNISNAKLLTNSISEIKEALKDFTNIKDVRVIEVQNYITKKGNKRYCNIDWNKEKELTEIEV